MRRLSSRLATVDERVLTSISPSSHPRCLAFETVIAGLHMDGPSRSQRPGGHRCTKYQQARRMR